MKAAFIAMAIAGAVCIALLFVFIKLTEMKGAEMGLSNTTYEQTK